MSSEAGEEQKADPAAAAFANLVALSGGSVDAVRSRPTARPEPQRDQSPRRRRWSGAGPSARDPQSLQAAVANVVRRQGWAEPLQHGTIFADWARLVGADNARKSRPVELTDKVLHVEAISTAWATQLRTLERQILRNIERVVGAGLVEKIVITGPKPPSWRRGPRTVRGRGPRDTYG